MSEAQTRLPWTAEEDTILIDLVQKYGEKRWNMVANGLPGRTGKGCSHRWRTYLRPDVKHPHLEPFTEWEAAVIVQAQRDMGNNWLAIAKLLLPGRSNTAVKNFWHCRLKSGSGTHTNRFIVENYNLRFLLTEVPEKDRLHPVALPAFPSTAPTGHVRRQIHPRPRQEAAAQAAAAAEAALMAQQIAAQAQAMGMDPQTYMQQAGMMDPSYAGMYASYEQMCLGQQGYAAMPPPNFSSKDELKQHASAYVQQQLAMMGHPTSSRHASGGGSSSRQADYGMQGAAYSGAGWQGGYDSSGAAPAAAAAAAAAGGTKKPGRGRGRPPGSKNQNSVAKADAAADAAAAAAAAAAEQQMYAQQQQQYSMTARASQDEAATWCSTGLMLDGSAAAAAAGGGGGAGVPHGSPGGEAHSSATYMLPQHMPPGSAAPGAAAAAAGAGPAQGSLDPAALAAAPVPLGAGSALDAAGGIAGEALHSAAEADAGAVGPECTGLLPTCAAAAAELNRQGNLRVSWTALGFDMDAAGAGSSSVRFSERTLRIFTEEEAAAVPGACKASMSSMDFPDQFRHSLTSLDMDLLGGSAANRMSEHTHIALRGPSWDGGNNSSPRSQPSDAPAAAGAPAQAAAGIDRAAAAAAPAAAYSMHGAISSEADQALAAAFSQRQQQQVLMPPACSAGMAGPQGASWVAAQQPPNSAAAAAAAACSAAPAASAGIHPTGSFSFPVLPAQQEDQAAIHPGAYAAGEVPASFAQGGPCSATPFGAMPVQAAPFSPVEPDAATAAALVGPSGVLPEQLVTSGGMASVKMEGTGQGLDCQQHQQQQPLCAGAAPAPAPAAAAAGPCASNAGAMQSQHPPAAPRMPPAFHSVLQALQPPQSGPSSGGSMSAAVGPMGIGYLEAEPQHQHQMQQQQQQQPYPQQQQQQLGCDPALAAASPAIMGASMPSSACPPILSSTAFLLPAAAAAAAEPHYQQHPHQQQQMAMPMPLPPQLLMLPPQHQQAGGHRVSDLGMGPLPSPIDLFNGDHGLHTAEDLLIGTDEVFDERLLGCPGSNGQQQHTQQQQQRHGQHIQQQQAVHHAAAMHGMPAPAQMGHWAQQHSSQGHSGHMQAHHAGAEAAPGAVSTTQTGQGYEAEQHHGAAASALHQAHAAAGLQAAAGHQEQPDASSRQGVKRRRSSANGMGLGKKARPSEGSLVEVYSTGAHHGVDDCLNFWHHDD